MNFAIYNTTITFNIVWKGVDFKIHYYTDESNYIECKYTWGKARLAYYDSFEKEGYYCAGFTAPKYDNQFFRASSNNYSSSFNDVKYNIEPNETLIFIVNWEPINYNVVIDNYTLEDKKMSCQFDMEYLVPETLDYKDGYNLVSYSIEINGSVVGNIKTGEKFINSSAW